MTVKSLINTEEFIKDVLISELDLDESFRSQASMFAHYAVIHFTAMQQAAEKKTIRDVVSSQVDKSIREAAAIADPPRKLTEAIVDAEIQRTKSYVSAQRECIEADAILSLAKNALAAFDQRKDMLIQLGANAREQMKGELVMNTQISKRETNLKIYADAQRAAA